MPRRYAPPKALPEDPTELRAEMRRQLETIAQVLAELDPEPGDLEALTDEVVVLAPGSTTRVSPQAAGQAGVFPGADAGNRGKTITVLVVAPQGTLTLRPLDGTVNGAAALTTSASGLITLRSDGDSEWLTQGNPLPAAEGAELDFAPVDATYLVQNAHADLPNARRAVSSAEIAPSFGVAGVVSWVIVTASIVLSKLADLAGLSVLGRASNSSGVMAPITAGTQGHHLMRVVDTLAWGDPSGEGLTTSAFGVISVNGSTSIDIASDQVRRAALTGAITAPANNNTTAFGALAAKSVLANATNLSAVPAALAGSAAFQHLRVNSVNSALEWSLLTAGDFGAGIVPLTALATQAAGTMLANITAGVASPTAHSLTTFAGGGLTYTNVTGILAVGAGTGITVNANDVAINQAANLTWTGTHAFNGAALTADPSGAIDLDAGTTAALSGTTLSLTASSGNASLTSSTGNVTIQASAGPAQIDINASEINLNGAMVEITDGQLRVLENASVVGSMATGESLYWVRNDSPNVPMFRDDTNVDHQLAFTDHLSKGDTATTGTVTTYSILKTDAVILVDPPGAVTLRGATVPVVDGQRITFMNGRSSANNWTINHEDASAATAANRFNCPGNANLTLTPGHTATFQYSFSRWRILSTTL